MESSVQHVMELLRPKGEQSPSVLQKYKRRIDYVIGTLEAAADQICSNEVRMDRLAVAIALEYTDFRIHRSWRDQSPKLMNWLETESQRPSLVATRPQERSTAPPAT